MSGTPAKNVIEAQHSLTEGKRVLRKKNTLASNVKIELIFKLNEFVYIAKVAVNVPKLKFGRLPAGISLETSIFTN